MQLIAFKGYQAQPRAARQRSQTVGSQLLFVLFISHSIIEFERALRGARSLCVLSKLANGKTREMCAKN